MATRPSCTALSFCRGLSPNLIPLLVMTLLVLVPLLTTCAGAIPEAAHERNDVGDPRSEASTEVRSSLIVNPYLQHATETGVTVMWWTTSTSDDQSLELGRDFSRRLPARSELIPAMELTLHSVRIELDETELGKAIPYRVRSGSEMSPESTFTVQKRGRRAYRFAFIGDGRTDDAEVIRRQRALLERIDSRSPELLFYTGDMVYSGDREHWLRFFRQIVTDSDPTDPGLSLAGRVPIYFVVGNHEIYHDSPVRAEWFGDGNLDTTMARYRAFVDVPNNDSQNEHFQERYYAVDYGPATFIVLDVNNTSADELDNDVFLPDNSTPDWEPGSEQHTWLVAQLERASSRSAYTFVLTHHAPYTRGEHGNPEDSQSGWQLRALDPLFHRMGVAAVISGHDHLVERAVTRSESDEVHYFVNGNGGHSTRPAGTGWEQWIGDESVYFYDWAGTEHTSFLELSISPMEGSNWRAELTTVRNDGEVFDRVRIERRSPRSSL